MMPYVILSRAGLFYAGKSKWVMEYPDALLFDEDSAFAVLNFGKLNNWKYFSDADIWKDYGLSTEKKIE